MLPVKQADDVPLRVGQLQNDDIAWLKVRMADAEMTKSRVPRDE